MGRGWFPWRSQIAQYQPNYPSCTRKNSELQKQTPSTDFQPAKPDLVVRIAPSILLICSLISSACKHEPLPEAFIIPTEATDVEHLKFRGMDQVSYQLHITFPAASPIQKTSRQLQSQGWMPLKEKFLQPGTASSLEVGWTYAEDNRVGGSTFLYEWTCDWKDQNSNIITYSFQYRDPIEKYRKSTYILKPSSSNLKVIVIYMPQEVALLIRKEAMRRPKS